jgi:outer membrane receptor for ferrienterochelin and colicin
VRSQRLLDAGFYDRAARGIGFYIHPEQLRESRSAHLSDFLARIPGVRRALVDGETSRIDLRGGRSVYLTCDTQYFLDGASVPAGAAILDNLAPHNVAGIEVYRGASETPIQFDYGRASCGAVVIWTRRN